MNAYNFKNITGQTFGRLTALHYKGSRKWEFKCSCGTIKVASGKDVRTGKTQSCGCLNKERTAAAASTHGYSGTSTYNTWKGVKYRCSSSRCKAYKDYGGRGITVCDRWLNSFENFLEDMGERPSSSHSIDRIDVNGNYEPSNCRWATRAEQNNNQRQHSNAFVFDGKSSKQLAQELGIHYSSVIKRVKRAGNLEVRTREPLLHENRNCKSWAAQLGVSRGCVQWRLQNGKDPYGNKTEKDNK